MQQRRLMHNTRCTEHVSREQPGLRATTLPGETEHAAQNDASDQAPK